MRVGEHAGEPLGTGIDGILTHGVKRFEKILVVFGKHLAQNVQTQVHVFLQCRGKRALFGTFGAEPGRHDRGVGRRDQSFDLFLQTLGCSVYRSSAAPPQFLAPIVASPQPVFSKVAFVL